ncbi:hypothetical protein NX059_010081 [Plenodomus lindquistii]|nr:hypothetical protein NX059_010081 [Plenodomus lindquistii]
MLRIRAWLFTAFVALSQAQTQDGGPNVKRYSLRMAQSIMSRNQGIFANATDSSIFLQAAFVQKAFTQLALQYPNESTTDAVTAYIEKSVDAISPALSNATRNVGYSLDRLGNGNALLSLLAQTGSESYNKSVSALRASIDLQPRNSDGSLWYYVYPHWGYLDGMYSFVPFLTAYSLSQDPVDNTTTINNVLAQLSILWSRCFNTQTGLLVHGFDASRTAVWVDKTSATGASPHVWGRSMGWYVMALVDTHELLPSTPAYHKARAYLADAFEQLAKNLVLEPTRDAETGAWWQVLDRPGQQGNYVESSASSMFVYALLKGVKLGLIQDTNATDYTGIARRAYAYLVKTFVVEEGEGGVLGWNGTVAVCSLNSTATFEYYVGRPILYDSVLGSAAFVLASLEIERC